MKGKIPTAASDIFHDPDAWRRAHQKALRALESAEKLDVQVLNYRQPEYPPSWEKYLTHHRLFLSKVTFERVVNG
jgi:hypothetical protein